MPPSGAGSVRSEPWKRTPKSLAHSAKARPPQSFLSERRTDPAEHPIRPAERDRSAASLGSEQQNPSRTARKPHPPQSFLSERRTDPAEPPNTPSGAGSVRSEPWKRTTKSLAHSAKAPSSPELPQRAQDRSRGASNTPSGAGSVRSEPWKRTAKTLAHSAKARPPRASSASAGPIPRSTPYAQRSGIGPQRALEANTKIPRAKRESPSSQSFLSERRTDPAEPPTRPAPAGSVRSEPWKRTPKPLAHSAKARPSQSFLSDRRTDPAEHPIRPAERDRSAASLGSDHQNPSRTARKPVLPRASSASEGPIPRSTPYAQRSGIGPQRALKAITKAPRATRESPILPRAFLQAKDRSRGAPHTPSASGIGPQRALEANTKAPRAQRESPSFPELPQRPQDRSRGAPHTPSGAGSVRSEPWKRTPKSLAQSAKARPSQSFLSERRTDPAEHPIRPAERDRSGASIEGDHQSPSRKARKPHPPPSLPASVGPIPRSISTLAQGQRQPLTPRAPCQIGASL
jgi:hypothetical protein